MNDTEKCFDERVLKEVERLNASKGEYTDCPICNGKTIVYKPAYNADFHYWYCVATSCSCYQQWKSKKLAHSSGIEQCLNDLTFDNYVVESEWQANVKNKAMGYTDGWFYIGGGSGCVDCDTEYFTGTEWKKISEYDGNKVLQYNPKTKEASLTQPLRYISKPTEKLYQISTLRGSVNMCLSDDHSFAYITSKGHMQKKKFSEVMEIHQNRRQGFYGKIETAFLYSGKGIDLTDNEIRLMCAVMADGCFRNKVNFCDIRVKKQRKKERMRELLKNVKHKEYFRGEYSVFRFYAPRKEKEFTDYWYQCNNHQLKIICDEVIHWDGSVNGKRKMFFSTSKKSADFIQFAFSATGNRSTIGTDNFQRNDNRERPVCYYVNCVSGNSTVSMVCSKEKTKAKIEEFKPKDQKQYCFTVETGYLVLRRGNRIFITGNCGKTHICTAIAGRFLATGTPTIYMLWSDESKKLKRLVNDNDYEKHINKFKTAELLYIDDLFKVKDKKKEYVSDGDVKLAFEILNYRYINKLKTVISSEFYLSELIEIDSAIAGRIKQMAKNNCLSIKRDLSRNYRLK